MTGLERLSPATLYRKEHLPNLTALSLEWGERAAIREHEGGATRPVAEVRATRDLWKRYPGCFDGINPLSLIHAFKEAEQGRDGLLHVLLLTDLYPPNTNVVSLSRQTA